MTLNYAEKIGELMSQHRQCGELLEGLSKDLCTEINFYLKKNGSNELNDWCGQELLDEIVENVKLLVARKISSIEDQIKKL